MNSPTINAISAALLMSVSGAAHATENDVAGTAENAQSNTSRSAPGAERMEASLVALADESRAAPWSVFGRLVNGAGLLTMGGIVAFSSDDAAGSGVFRTVLAAGGLWLGSSNLIEGIHGLSAGPSADEERLARFRSHKVNGTLDERTLARYEGELQAVAALAERRRIRSGVEGIATGTAGGLLIAFTAISELRHDRRSQLVGYATGGGWLVFGTWQSIVYLTDESFEQRVWRSYQDASSASGRADIRLGLAPLPGGFGIGMNGRF